MEANLRLISEKLRLLQKKILQISHKKQKVEPRPYFWILFLANS